MIRSTTQGGRGPALACGLGIGAAVALLALSGRTLPFPPTVAPDELLAWADEVGPTTAAFTTVRALALLLVCWFAGTWLLAVLVRLSRLPGAVRAADGLALPYVRRLADLVAGTVLVAATLVPAAQAGAATPDTRVSVTMHDLGPTTPVPATIPMTGPTLASPPPAVLGPASTIPAAGDDARTWVITPGDTLWHVAERSAADELGRPPSGEEVLQQLDRLVGLNVDRLAIPGDADLVFPGQTFLLP